jgi:hypothetical protein
MGFVAWASIVVKLPSATAGNLMVHLTGAPSDDYACRATRDGYLHLVPRGR